MLPNCAWIFLWLTIVWGNAHIIRILSYCNKLSVYDKPSCGSNPRYLWRAFLWFESSVLWFESSILWFKSSVFVRSLPVVRVFSVWDEPSCGSNRRCLWGAFLWSLSSVLETSPPVVGIVGVCEEPSCGPNPRCLWQALLWIEFPVSVTSPRVSSLSSQ